MRQPVAEQEARAQQTGRGTVPPPTDHAAQDAAAALAATRATVDGIASSPPYVAESLTVAAVNAAAAGMLASFARFLTGRQAELEQHLALALAELAPVVPEDERRRIVAGEMDAERAYQAKASERLARDLRLALSITDPARREDAVARLLDRERRVMLQREAALTGRVIGAGEQMAVEVESPEGGYWELDDSVQVHTPDCVAMAGKVWPHSLLRIYHPPLHPGCPCRIRTVADARARGLVHDDSFQSRDQSLFALSMTETPVAADVVIELLETRWDDRLHPRGRLGRFVDKLGDALRGRRAQLGVTPYLQRRDRQSPRATFEAAAALHSHPEWRPVFAEFEQEAERLADEHQVDLVSGERNVGVFEGVFEPSYTLRVRGAPDQVDAFNEELGRAFDQKAVVAFRRDPAGPDAEVRVTPGEDPDAFYRELVDALGQDAGATYDANEWRVFIPGGDFDTTVKVIAVVQRLGLRWRRARGHGSFIRLRGGEG